MQEKKQAAKPKLKQKKRLSKIWIVPIVALLIGAGMLWDYFEKQGTVIEVSFLTAEGLEAKKTKVKTRNVDVGLVKKVYFSDDRTEIIAEIEIDKGMEDFLRQDTQFWVVKPRVGVGGISGLGTLLSGAYIELSPGQSSEEFEDEFKGLESPPVTPLNASGIHLTLIAKGVKPLAIGSPVIYRGFSVGQIDSFKFDIEKRHAVYDIFIESPYDSLITTNTFFWNAGGLSVETTTTGLKVNVPTIDSLISGGVQFDIPEDLPLGEKIAANKTFALYADESSVYESREYEYVEYALLVEDSVGGLYAGAPVEYRGIRIGTVVHPYLTLAESDKFIELKEDTRIPVIIKIEPERIIGDLEVISIAEFTSNFNNFIKDGMVASIESGNLLFGSLKISLDYTGKPVDEISKVGDYLVIPTTAGGLGKITDKVTRLLTKINQLPLEDTLTGANKTIASADKALVSMESALNELTDLLKQQSVKKIPVNLDKALIELQKTLQGFQPSSQVYSELEETMIDLQNTLNSLQPLLKELNNKPNSLIFGQQQGVDIEPKAKGK